MAGVEGRLLVHIPTYNDFSELQRLVDEIHEQLDATVLVVDDGSQKDAPHLDGCLYVKLPFNLGLGVSTQVAVRYALIHGFDYLVRIDADGQHPVSAIKDVMAKMTDADICVAARRNRHSGTGLRRYLSWLARSYISVVSRLLHGDRLPRDLNTGFICMNVHAMAALRQFELDRYPEPQMFIILASRKMRFGIIDIEQLDRSEGKSSLSAWTGVRLLYRVTLYTLMATMGAYQ